MQASWNVYGPYTCMINICPYENNMHWVFEMAGKKYEFDTAGRPFKEGNAEGRAARLSKEDCAKVIARNPVACAHAFHAYLAAFCEVFLGWPLDAEEQKDCNCIFGTIFSF